MGLKHEFTKFLHLATSAATLSAIPYMARAQGYPARPIRLVVPFPPGGAFDFVGRPWADKMKPLVGAVVIENIGGGGSSLGAAAVARAKPDGYTILLGGTQTHVNEALLKSKPLYYAVKDLHPIAGIAANALGIAVHPSVPAQNLKELIASIPHDWFVGPYEMRLDALTAGRVNADFKLIEGASGTAWLRLPCARKMPLARSMAQPLTSPVGSSPPGSAAVK